MSHSLTLVLFSRSYAPKHTKGSSHAPQGLMRDAAGRTYTDHYKLVVENESRSEWEPLLAQLKRHFQLYRHSLRRHDGGAPGAAAGGGGGGDGGGGGAVAEAVSDALSGNMLEAINLALDVLECSYEEQDLSMTGKSVVVLSAGSGVYEVDYRLSQMTKQRILDDGIGCDLNPDPDPNPNPNPNPSPDPNLNPSPGP